MPDALTLFDRGPFELAEGPIWIDGRLYWVDITAGVVHQRRSGWRERESVALGQSVGCLFAADDGGLIAGVQDGLARIDFERGIVGWLDRSLAGEGDRRCNDGKRDPRGRILVGSMLDGMREGSGLLHRLGPQGLEVVRSGLTIPNGLAWSEDGSRMYHIDSPRRIVEILEYDLDEGRVGALVGGFQTPKEFGYPDGMCIDGAGHLWIGHWGGGCVTRWDPVEGRMLGRIGVPAEHVTSCCFGGEGGSDLFLTTAASDRTGPGAVYRWCGG